MRVRVKFGGGCERIIPQISYEARFTGRETGGGGRPVWPCGNYPAARELAGIQVHSQQALIRVSFIETTVFLLTRFTQQEVRRGLALL